MDIVKEYEPKYMCTFGKKNDQCMSGIQTHILQDLKDIAGTYRSKLLSEIHILL